MNHQREKKSRNSKRFAKDKQNRRTRESIDSVFFFFVFFGGGIVGRTNGWEEKCEGSNKKITQKMRLKRKGCMKNKVRVRYYEGRRRVKSEEDRLNKMYPQEKNE